MANNSNVVHLKSDGGSRISTVGFYTDAKKFLSANRKIAEAKKKINQCKQLIVDFDLDNDDCKKLKNNINGCNINALANLVETTKNNLLEIDQEFSSQYFALLQNNLQNVDLSTLTDEERLEYSILVQDYDKSMFAMLSKLNEIDALSAGEKEYYDYLKLKNDQYDIQDKMSVLDPRSKEYIDLFKKNANIDRELIFSNTNLSDVVKKKMLSDYEKQYNANLSSLQEARDNMLYIEGLEKKLADLQQDKEDNNGFFHPVIESEIEEAILDTEIALGKAKGYDVSDKEAYKNMNGWDRFWTDAGTFVTSTFTGLFDIVESMSDGLLMLTLGWNDSVSAYIARDISGEMYDGLVMAWNMNTHSAYGDAHTAGMAFGNTIGHIGMSFACPWANAVMSGLEAMGSTSENVLVNGGSYWEAMGLGLVSGVGGAMSGYAMSSLNANAMKFLKSGALKTIGGSVVNSIKSNGLKAVLTGAWNSAGITGKAVGKMALAALIDADALVESGCVFASNIISGIAEGDIDWETAFKQTAAVYGSEVAMNFLMGLAMNIGGSAIKTSMDIDTKSEVEHMSGTNMEINKQLKVESSKLDSDNLTNTQIKSNKVDGIEPELSKQTKVKELSVRATLESRFPDYDLSQYSFDELKKMFPEEVSEITRQQYKDLVLASKQSYTDVQGMAKVAARADYELLNGLGSFDELDLSAQTKAIEAAKTELPAKGTEEYLLLERNYAEDVANTTISSLEKLKADGKLLAGVEVDDVLMMIQDDVDPSMYLTSEAIDEWRKAWQVDSSAPEGMVNTYTFQSENKGVLAFNTVGYSDEGAFAITESQYKWIMDPANGIFKDGVCVNRAALTEVLGGVDFGTGAIVCVKQTIPIDAVKMPTGNLKGAFLGDWCPGGKTSGGAIEGITPPNKFNYVNSVVNDSSLTVSGNVEVNGVLTPVASEIKLYGSTGTSKTSYLGFEIFDKLSLDLEMIY